MSETGKDQTLGVLLDLDGTIVNSMIPLKQAFIKVSSAIGVTIGEEQQKRIGKDLRMIMGGRTTRFSELRLIWRIGGILGLPLWKKALLPLTSYFELKRTAYQAPPVEGVVEAIKSLKKDPNIKLGLVTSRNRRYVISKLRSLDLIDCFDVILTREDVHTFKPSPEQIILAAKTLNLPVQRCVLVGDMPTDVDAARRANAVSVAVVTGIFLEEIKSREPDFIIGSLADLPNLIDAIWDRLSKQNETS